MKESLDGFAICKSCGETFTLKEKHNCPGIQGADMKPETQPWMKVREGMPEWDNEPVSHEQAKQAVLAFTDEHFRQKRGRTTQFRIPADKNDTDLLLMRYVRQQEWLAAHAPQQWIPVSERLPRDYEHVLCAVVRRKKMNPQSWLAIGYYSAEYGWGDVEDQSNGEPYITHWMPLPAPPVPDKEMK